MLSYAQTAFSFMYKDSEFRSPVKRICKLKGQCLHTCVIFVCRWLLRRGLVVNSACNGLFTYVFWSRPGLSSHTYSNVFVIV